MIDLRRGDVVLVAFPFLRGSEVQANRYNRRRAAVILAAITSTQARRELPCKVSVARDSREGREAGLRTDSVMDCQTLVTVPREEVVGRLGAFPKAVVARIDRALQDALGLAGRASPPS